MTAPLTWRRSRALPVVAGVLGAAALALFIVEVVRSGFDPGSLTGEILGIGAATMLAVVMAYSARRSLPAVRSLGLTRRYLDLHVWGGALFLVLVTLHAGLRVPTAGLTLALWLLSLWVVVTGAVGLLLQRTLPRVLEPSTSFEANLQRIPELVADIRTRAELAAQEANALVKAYYRQRVAPNLVAPRFLSLSALGRGRSLGSGGDRGELETLRRTLDAEGLVALEVITAFHTAKHELDVHFTVQRVLRGWLVFHLPAAIALIALVVLHVFLVLYY